MDGIFIAPGSLLNVELNSSKKQIIFKQVQLHHSINVMFSNASSTVLSQQILRSLGRYGIISALLTYSPHGLCVTIH